MDGFDYKNIKNLSESRKNKSKLAGVKIIKDDLKYFINNKKKLVALIVIAFIPLLYSFLYLDAFWDPYSKLDKMPIAVVNMDKGSEKDDKTVNYGKDLLDQLKDNKKVKWEFTDYKDAEDGLKNKKYYSMVVIPEDFSRVITDSVDGEIEKASISYIPNEKKNFLAAQVSSRIMLELKDEISRNITNEGTKIAVDSLYKAKDGMKEALDGSSELKEGAGELRDGAHELDGKMGDLKNGAVQLKDGSNALLEGLISFERQSGSGKGKLISGAQDLWNGTGKAFDGIKEYDAAVTDGENELKKGAGDLSSGLDELAGGFDEYDTKISDGENQLKDATGKISDGAGKLEAGFNEYNAKVAEGQNQLASASAELKSGFTKLLNGFGEYGSKASDGQGQLKSGALDLAVGISSLNSGLQTLNSNFTGSHSNDIPNLINGSSTVSGGIAGTADAVASLSGLITGSDLINKVNASDLGSSDKLALTSILDTIQALSTPEKLPALKAGAAAIAAGAQNLSALPASVGQISAGASAAKTGADQLVSGLYQFQTESSQGVQSLVNGVNDLKNGTDKFLSGVNESQAKSSEGIQSLFKGVGDIKSGTDQLYEGFKDFQAQSSHGRQALVKGADDLKAGAGQLYTGISELHSQGVDARKSILDGESRLLDGSGTLLSGLKEFDSQTSDGVKKLIDGASELNSGEAEAVDGVGRLQGEGTSKLKNGLDDLYNGTEKLNDGLKDGYEEMNGRLKASSEDMSGFLSEPVTLNEKPINHVPDYGTGFSPYFIPLSLWVGALLMFLIVPMEVNKKYKNSPKSVVFGKFAMLMAIGILQAVISSIIILTVLHLQVQNVALFMGFNILLSAAFIAIIQSLVYLLGDDAGKFFALVLLMLQLTSCGGTFPMEIVPRFFGIIQPWLPMTYGTSGLREIISGIDYNVLRNDALILAAFAAGFITLSISLKSRVEKIKDKIITLKGAKEEIA